jgi:hypothetical protein
MLAILALSAARFAFGVRSTRPKIIIINVFIGHSKALCRWHLELLFLQEDYCWWGMDRFDYSGCDSTEVRPTPFLHVLCCVV